MTTGKSVQERGEWSSKVGFILAAAGSAIGLGNIWRFPYTAGEHGGAAFLFLYLICIALLGLPIMIAELALGRYRHRNAVGAFEAIKPGSAWKLVGFLGVITGICIWSFYSVIAGYTVGFIGKTLIGNTLSYEAFASNPWISIPLTAFFIFLTVIVVQGGVRNGIERWAKILMPILFLLMVVLIIRSVTMKGAGAGLVFYLKPDLTKITGKTVLAALGQAFFSLSLGMGCMITYGSYLSKKDNLITSGCFVAFFDTLIAVMAGFLIFPALFAQGMEAQRHDPGLLFKVLPQIFSQIPGGNLVGASFFLLLAIAALTSTISLLEVVTAYLVDEKHWLRRRAVWITAAVTFLLALPSAMSQEGMVPALGQLPLINMSFLGLMNWTFGNITLAIGALLTSIFFGWIWKSSISHAELSEGCPWYRPIAPVLSFLLKFFCPLTILVVLIFFLYNTIK
ncbi:MAG: sodium-dependent transporter [Candidatus Krumholzibacteriota bacterium]|nr:sodium-dependent transporter [Candidatus Krumholzibacteriota bacterium]